MEHIHHLMDISLKTMFSLIIVFIGIATSFLAPISAPIVALSMILVGTIRLRKTDDKYLAKILIVVGALILIASIVTSVMFMTHSITSQSLEVTPVLQP
jgi:hypothetical protein